MSRLVARDIEVAFGNRRVLRGCELVVRADDKVGLVGPNGSGKSTLMRVIAGDLAPDHGRVEVSGRLGWLPQEPRLAGETVADAAAGAVAWHRALLDAWEAAVARGDEAEAGRLHDRIEAVGWRVEHRVAAMLDRLGAPPPEARVAKLSGGERRRVALALALLDQPDVLLLDEPTNHLAPDAVEWLEGWLGRYRGALVLVTHDRYLLEKVATAIVEVEDGRTVRYPGSYGDYLVARAERQASRQRAEERRLRILAREAAWAARSPAARTTRQKARLDRLAALREREGLRVERGFELDLRTGTRRGVLLEGRGLRKAWGGRELIGGLDLPLSAGERLGVMGPNGSGKSTLLAILAGRLAPDAGTVQRAPRVKVALFDQARSGLEAPDGSDWTVFEAAGGGNSHVFVGGRPGAGWQRGAGGRESRAIHVASFLDRFLFPRESLDQPVSTLSGGERARLLLARLLLQGAGVLLLDEPTNDLDLATLRVLEEALLAFDGAAVVVTHDRAFLDRTCTGVLAFGETPPPLRAASRAQVLAAAREEARPPRKEARPPRKEARAAPRRRDRLGYREQRELAALPGRIEALEAEAEALAATLADPATYRERGEEVAGIRDRLSAVQAEVEALYERWAALESRA